MVGCGIDTNPFPSNSDDTLSAPSDGMSDDMPGESSAESDDATDGEGVDTGSADPNRPPTCDMDEQGRAPYTIFHADTRRLLVGNVSSVQADSSVQILDASGTQVTQLQSAEDGSFAFQSQTTLPTAITVRSEANGGSSTEVNVGLTDATTAAYASSQQITDAWLESDFADDSGFSVEQAADTFELSATSQTLLPGLSVVLANLSQGMAMVEKVSNDGSFQVWVQADSGDTIVSFTVEHGSSNGGGLPLTLEAP